MLGCSEGNDAKFSVPLCNVYSQKLPRSYRKKLVETDN